MAGAHDRYRAYEKCIADGVHRDACGEGDNVGDGDAGNAEGDVDETPATGVVPADVLATVGSYQPRQADGNYLNAEEQAFVAEQVGCRRKGAASGECKSAAVHFDCSKLITPEKMQGAREGEKQWRWP